MGEIEQFVERGFGASVVAVASGPVMRWALVPLGGVALAPIALIATGTVSGPSVAAALASPLSVLAARSPGERPNGPLALSKTKMAREDERRLADFARRTPGPTGVPGPYGSVPGPVVGPLGDGSGEPIPDAFVADPLGGGDLVAGPVPSGFVPGPGPIFATDTIPGTGGGGGGGGTTPGPVTDVPPAPPIVSEVPEPATWLMLIFGFGAIGRALRSRGGRATHRGALRPGG